MDQGHRSRARVGHVLVCVALAVIAFRPLLAVPHTVPAILFEFWLFDPGETAAPLVLLGVVWLVVARGRELLLLPLTPARSLAGACFGLAAAMHIWAVTTGAFFLLVPALMALILGAGALRAGVAGCRALSLPVALLALAIPIPAPLQHEIVWAFQLGAAELAAATLHLGGEPAMARGMVLERPGMIFIVIESCSGFRFVFTFVALALVMRGAAAPSGWRTALLAVIGATLGLLLNLGRILWIVLGSGALAVGDAHFVQGVVVLLVGVPLLYAAHRFVDGPRPRQERSPRPFGREALVSVLAIQLLLAGFATLSTPPIRVLADSFELRNVPEEHERWSSEGISPDFLLYSPVHFDEVIRRVYVDETGVPVELFIGASLGGDPFGSPFAPSVDLPEMGWSVAERRVHKWATREVEELVLVGDGGLTLGYMWRVGDEGFWAETLRAFLALDAPPFHSTRRRAVVRVVTPLDGNGPAARERAEQRLDEFLKSDIGAALPGISGDSA